MDLYAAKTVCKVCGVRQRMLDYWIATDVVRPTRRLKTNRRTFFFFGFDTILYLRMVTGLRATGLPLQRIREAVKAVQAAKNHSPWLVTDGENLFQLTDDPTIVKALAKRERGQLAFSFVAIGAMRESVTKELRNHEPVDLEKFRKTWVKLSV